MLIIQNKIKLYFSILLLGVLFFSCKNENKFIGTWIEKGQIEYPDTIKIIKDGDKIIISYYKYYKSDNANFIGNYDSKENCLIYQNYRLMNAISDGPYYKIHYLKNKQSILINNSYYEKYK